MIRIAEKRDIDTLISIEQTTNHSPWTSAMMWSSFQEHDICIVEEYQNEEVIKAYLISQTVSEESTLLHLVVDRKYQAQGYGRQILIGWLKQLDQKVKTIWLEVRASNSVAQNLYQSTGFELVTKRKNYYKFIIINATNRN